MGEVEGDWAFATRGTGPEYEGVWRGGELLSSSSEEKEAERVRWWLFAGMEMGSECLILSSADIVDE